MYIKKIEIGSRFGTRTVVEELSERKNGYIMYRVLCDCGDIARLNGTYLRDKERLCPSCSSKKRTKKGIDNPLFKHGHASWSKGRNRIYHIWVAMRQRCNDPNDKNYKNYGGRGISVCDEWDDFCVFYKDMGDRPEGLQLDRIDNDKNYSKENCRWADRKIQANNRRNTRYHLIESKKVPHTQILEETGVSRYAYRYRENKDKYNQKNLKKRQRKGTYQLVDSASRNKDHPLHSMYKSWGYMKRNCSGMCESWEIFLKFVEDMGQKPSDKRLLRHDTSKPFNKENCYWG